MKLLGGSWSRGDILALVGVVAAILAIPGMPKLLHLDSTDLPKKALPPIAAIDLKPATPASNDAAEKEAIEKKVASELAEGAVAWDLRRFGEAAALYRKAADAGSPEAMLRMGAAFEFGRGARRDLQQA